jgi:hypothetical protein
VANGWRDAERIERIPPRQREPLYSNYEPNFSMTRAYDKIVNESADS